MTRTRMRRITAAAVLGALLLTLAGMPVAAGAAPVRARSATRALSTAAVSLAGVTDDNIAGAVDTSLPVSVSGSLDASTDPALDADDVYRVWLGKGDRFVATLTVAPDAGAGIWVFGPGATDIWVDDILAETDEDYTLSFYAPVSGYYYVDVWALWPQPADPDLGIPEYPGWAGAYTLEADAIPPSPTSIGIRTSATTARTGSIPILSGAVTPNTMIGKNIVVYVKKPGKTYWTYSSNRTVYNRYGSAAWLYKYYFKPGMVKGYYVFRAVVPAYPGFLTSGSPNTVTIRLR